MQTLFLMFDLKNNVQMNFFGTLYSIQNVELVQYTVHIQNVELVQYTVQDSVFAIGGFKLSQFTACFSYFRQEIKTFFRAPKLKNKNKIFNKRGNLAQKKQ